ncbi:hypothetical protein [Nonomuraea sp. NPDC049758]|uniref:hypothetical protein n=1 Tax=Nonomuraea sp. NPDC049758 TaxID=3154360 RepID=UPI003441CFDF
MIHTSHPRHAGCLGALTALGATVLIAVFGTAGGIGVPLPVSGVTAGHLRRLGRILIAGSLVSAGLGAAARAILSGMLLTTGPAFVPAPGVPLAGLVAGLCALGVSEIVRRGVALLDEVEAPI